MKRLENLRSNSPCLDAVDRSSRLILLSRCCCRGLSLNETWWGNRSEDFDICCSCSLLSNGVAIIYADTRKYKQINMIPDREGRKLFSSCFVYRWVMIAMQVSRVCYSFLISSFFLPFLLLLRRLLLLFSSLEQLAVVLNVVTIAFPLHNVWIAAEHWRI